MDISTANLHNHLPIYADGAYNADYGPTEAEHEKINESKQSIYRLFRLHIIGINIDFRGTYLNMPTKQIQLYLRIILQT